MNTKQSQKPNGETLTRLELGDRQVILIGTAHVSRQSVEEVREVILEEKPDRVCVEIDETRYNSLVKKQSWQNLNIGQVPLERCRSWPNGLDSKSSEHSRVPRVRIPPSPPYKTKGPQSGAFCHY